MKISNEKLADSGKMPTKHVDISLFILNIWCTPFNTFEISNEIGKSVCCLSNPKTEASSTYWLSNAPSMLPHSHLDLIQYNISITQLIKNYEL